MTTMKMFVYFNVGVVAAVVALAFALHVRAEGKQEGAKANETLLSATSPFEDMVEFALAKNFASVEKCLAKSEKHVASVKEALSPASVGEFERQIQTLHKVVAAKEHYAVAVCAVEIFRLLLDNLDAAKLKVPKEVSLLDFAGFKLHVLDAAPTPDWDGMRDVVAEAAGWWKTAKPKVSDKGLRDAVESTIRGMQQAVKTENLPMLHFAAQIDLDLVDVLEVYFEKKP
jgi:hypothetical protein